MINLKRAALFGSLGMLIGAVALSGVQAQSKTTLRVFYGSTLRPDVIAPIFQRFEKRNPQYTVISELGGATSELQNQYLTTALSAKDSNLDVMLIDVVRPAQFVAQGWLEPIAMDSARARLMEALRRRDTHGRLRMYHPFTQRGEAIYVHAKVMIVDDEMLRVGSSNLNNRSMRLDTECDIVIEAVGDAVAGASVRERIAAIRLGLIAEHLACDVATLDPDAPMIATIEALRGPGRSLRPYEAPNLGEIEKWLADNEVLDPEGPEEMFESLTKRSLFRRLRRLPA